MQFVIGGLVCPLRARISPNKPNSVAVKVKSRPIKPQIPQKLFIPSKSQAWTLFEGSLPRGSLVSTLQSYAKCYRSPLRMVLLLNISLIIPIRRKCNCGQANIHLVIPNLSDLIFSTSQ